jgi:ankyrin repeat protein
VVEFLLQCFQGEQPPVGDTRRSFVEAARAGRTDLLESLIARGVDVQYATFQGTTALHEAAVSGYVSSVEFLLGRGVDCRMADKFGMTAVFEASRYGHLAAVRRLVEAQGSLSDVINLSGETALHFAATRRWRGLYY